MRFSQLAIGFVASCSLVSIAAAQSQVLAWGDNSQGQCVVPPLPVGITYTRVAGGHEHSAAIRSDGALVMWGSNNSGQCAVPALPPGDTYLQVGSSQLWFATAALLSDGTIAAWGDNSYGQCDVPVLPAGVVYVGIDGPTWHTVAVRSDGACVAWGSNAYGQCDVPALPPGLAYVEAVGGGSFTVARRNDGSVVAWGRNDFGQCVVPPLPPGITYVELADGNSHALARRSDGTVVAWGYNGYGQCNVPTLPPGTTYTRIAAGGYHSLAVRSDGALLAWGDNSSGQCVVPVVPPGVVYVEVAAGAAHTIARTDSVFNGFCFGDGLDTTHSAACPCANYGAAGHGCASSSNASGGLLTATGSTNPDTVVLHGSGMPMASLCIYLQGDALEDAVFGDGVRCAGGSLIRLLTKSNVAGASAFPEQGDVSISTRGQVAPGSSVRRYYQTYYRNPAASFCPSATFNVTNGVIVDWY